MPEIWVRVELPNVVPDNEEHKRHVLKEFLRSKGVENNEHVKFDL